jgi:hypothetical protein
MPKYRKPDIRCGRTAMIDIGLVVDDKGELWADDAPELGRRLGRPDFGSPWAVGVVRDHGFIHVRSANEGVRITLRLGRFSLAALVGTIQAVYDLHPPCIIAHLLTDSGSAYERFISVAEFVTYVEGLADDWTPGATQSRIVIARDLRGLNQSSFDAAREVFALWKERRGELSPELHRTLILEAQRRWIVLLRQPRGSRHLLVEHFSAPIAAMRPCQALSLFGHHMEDMPDGDFGHWVARGYAETLSASAPRLESVLADIRTPDEKTIRSRYDRLLLPWRGRSDEFVLSVPLVRKRMVIAE